MSSPTNSALARSRVGVTALLFAALVTAAFAAAPAENFAPGGVVYTKRLETDALAEPQPLASAVGRFGYARKLKIEEVRGRWLRVSEGKTAGWVFAGNLAAEKPSEKSGLGNSPLLASETSATAAARPLAPSTADYSTRRGQGGAQADLEWLVGRSNAVTPEVVTAYLQENGKGEFAR